MIKQTTILTLLLALASPVAIACNPAEGSGQCGFLGAGGVIYSSPAEAYASYQQPSPQVYYESGSEYLCPDFRCTPPPPTHHCTPRAEGGEICADTRPGSIGSSYSKNGAGDLDGPMVKSYPDGTPKMIVAYRDGKREGKSSFFYPDGSIQSVMYYQNDKLNGSVQHFHPNGTLSGDMTYCNGETCGEERDYDEQGNLVRIIRYDANGDAESVQEITPGSQPHAAAKKSRRKS